MNSLIKNERVNGFMTFDHVSLRYYNDFNEKGNDPTCKHEFFTRKVSTDVNAWSVNHYCATCGYRRLFVKYAKYCKKGRK